MNPPTEWCPACRWQGSWDESVCPECGAAGTKLIEWTRCRIEAMPTLAECVYSGDEAGLVVIESDCKCGEHTAGKAFSAPAKQFRDKGLAAGDEFWIVANLDGVQGQILTLEEAEGRGKLRLLCKVCGETCGLKKGCDLYETEDDPHVHLPGGLRTYGLCLPCEEKCLEVHRPVDAAGKWTWIHDCGNPSCGYCKAFVAEMKKIYGRWPLGAPE